MKLEKATIITNTVFLVLLSVLCNFEWAVVGVAALLIAAINLFLSVLYFAIRKKDTAKTMLLCGGVLLLIGFSLCSSFQGFNR